MNYGYLYSAIMLVSAVGAHAMNQEMKKREASKGIPIAQQSPTSMPAVLQQDTAGRVQDYLRLKCAFATFVASVEKNRLILAALHKELGESGESAKEAEVLSLSEEVLNTLQGEVRAAKLLLAQNSGGLPATPPSSPADESLLPE